MKNKKIAIIGGGVAGATTAQVLGTMGLDVTLFEREKSLVNGPPFCHLHAGGNLYPDISDAQCVTLLRQSIDFLRFYPHVVDYRPTVVALPAYCTNRTANLLPRLKLLQKEYEALIHEDRANEVLGKSEAYYKLYSREAIEKLAMLTPIEKPQTQDEWMIPVAKEIAMDKVQFPLILVQEYGLNLFRLGASAALALEKSESVALHYETIVTDIEKQNNRWHLTYIKAEKIEAENFDYIINAAGFRTGKIDDMIGVECERMVEFKAAYVSHWEKEQTHLFPEIIFHGERGTPRGMGQFTPYPQGYFQLHGMTKEITLYEDGLVANTTQSCQPELGDSFIEKIESQWSEEETRTRTQSAIRHLSEFIPAFQTATVGSKPLFGAQQIPGDDPSLRVAEVSFPTEKYARCEIVKVSSVLDMITRIIDDLIGLSYIEKSTQLPKTYTHSGRIQEREIDRKSEEICLLREYPKALGKISVIKKY